MGNMADHHRMIIEPADVDTIIDFAYQCMQESSIDVIPADCIGYYNLKEMAVYKKIFSGTFNWQGCTAGKQSFGILHNGDILGCTSIRDKDFVEGNIRNTPLKLIWENPANFGWNRNRKKEDLGGFCSQCRFGDRCLGGCSNCNLTMGGSVNAENHYCSYNQAIKKRIKLFEQVESTAELVAMGRNFAEKGYCQLAESALQVAMQRNNGEDDIELLSLYGYVSFRLGNYQIALNANDRVLQKKPDDVYTLKGKGICLCRLGNYEDGIELLKQAVSLTDASFMDPYYDLAVILSEMGRKSEAIAVIEAGRIKSEQFISLSQDLYEQLVG